MPYRKTGAINTRKIFFKYYKIDDSKTLAVMAGRCKRCKKITDLFCSLCNAFVCENHTYKKHDRPVCYTCKDDECEPLSRKEIRDIRKAELKL